MAKNPIGRSLGTGHCGMTCQNEPPSENCDIEKDAIKKVKNSIEKSLGIGSCGRTGQNELPSENCEAKSEAIKMAKDPMGRNKGGKTQSKWSRIQWKEAWVAVILARLTKMNHPQKIAKLKKKQLKRSRILLKKA